MEEMQNVALHHHDANIVTLMDSMGSSLIHDFEYDSIRDEDVDTKNILAEIATYKNWLSARN